MTPRITLVLQTLLLCFSISVKGQHELDAIANTKPPECDEIAYASSVYFIQLVEKNKLDSAKVILDYWEGKCGAREPVFRAKIILAFATRRNVDSIIDDETLHQLYNYSRRAEMIRSRDFSGYDYAKPYFGFVPIGQEFDSFSIKFFQKAMKTENRYTTIYLLSEFYGDNTDTLFSKIKNEEYKGTRLYEEYAKLEKETAEIVNANYALLMTAWIPTGDISKLGIHPQIGFQIGGKYKKVNFDLTLAFKFLRSKTGYFATRAHSDKSVVYTDKFFGGYFGLDLGYDMWTVKNSEFQVIGGIGYDGFDAIDEDKSNDLKAESVSSYNFNFGVGYRYYIKGGAYIGLQAKYNLVDYTLNRVINFTGNPITISFIIGITDKDTHDPMRPYRYHGRWY